MRHTKNKIVFFFVFIVNLICGNLALSNPIPNPQSLPKEISIELQPNNFIYINGDFKEDSPEMIKASHQILNPIGPSIIIINSNGGDAGVALMLLMAMESSKKEFTCVALNASSSAFVVFMECQKRYILRYGSLMHHRIRFRHGTALQAKQDLYIQSSQTYLEMPLLKKYADIMKMPLAEFLALLNLDPEWYGQQAVDVNLAHGIAKIHCNKELSITPRVYTTEDDYYTYSHTTTMCPLSMVHTTKTSKP